MRRTSLCYLGRVPKGNGNYLLFMGGGGGVGGGEGKGGVGREGESSF